MSASSDVIATLAVHAGIAASDGFCLLTDGRHSKSGNHADAIRVLKAADGDSAALSRLLGEKTKAGYNVQSLTRNKSSKCIEWADKLLAAAEEKDLRGETT